MAQQCSYRVFSGRQNDTGGHLCGRNATNYRGGNFLCAMHTPEAVSERRERQQKVQAKALAARLDKEAEMRQRASEWPQLKQRITDLEAEVGSILRALAYEDAEVIQRVTYKVLAARSENTLAHNSGGDSTHDQTSACALACAGTAVRRDNENSHDNYFAGVGRYSPVDGTAATASLPGLPTASVDGWISVKDRLPEYGVYVLVVYHGTVQFVAYAHDIGKWRAIDDDADPMPESFVSHWHPLPAPPKAGR